MRHRLVKFAFYSTDKFNCVYVNHCRVENSFCPRAPETCLLAWSMITVTRLHSEMDWKSMGQFYMGQFYA